MAGPKTMVCVTEPGTGSRIARKEVCTEMSAADRAAELERQKDMRDEQRYHRQDTRNNN